MNLVFFAAITHSGCDDAYSRTLKHRKVLQSRLGSVEIDGRFNSLLLTIVDKPANYFKVRFKGPGDDVHQVLVGYNSLINCQPQENDKVIAILADWLRRIIRETEGYASKRLELLEIVNTWERETAERIADERRASAQVSGQ